MVEAAESDVSIAVQLEKLKDEINAKKKMISMLPRLWSKNSLPDQNEMKEKSMRRIAFLEEEYQMLLEVQRIESVVGENNAKFPPILEQCPLCLETVTITSYDSMAHFLCCGNGTCANCYYETTKEFSSQQFTTGDAQESRRGVMNRAPDETKLRECPICRSDFPISKADLVKKWAEKGRLWAQIETGLNYFHGLLGFEINQKEGMKWHELAADQHHPFALWSLGTKYSEGKFVTRNVLKGEALIIEAADRGFEMAQYYLGVGYMTGKTGLDRDLKKAAHYLTLAYCNEGKSSSILVLNHPGRVAFRLASLHIGGEGGFEKSAILAKHYLNEAANKGFQDAFSILAPLMADVHFLHSSQGEVFLMSHGDDVPGMMNWARKAAACGNDKAGAFVNTWKKFASAVCFECRNTVESEPFIKTFKCCGRCKSVYYCSKECQARSWRNGHKFECAKHG